MIKCENLTANSVCKFSGNYLYYRRFLEKNDYFLVV